LFIHHNTRKPCLKHIVDDTIENICICDKHQSIDDEIMERNRTK